MVIKLTNYTFELGSLFTDYTIDYMNISEIARLIGTNHVTLLPHVKMLVESNIFNITINGRNKNLFIDKKSARSRLFFEMVENYKTLKYIQDVLIIKKLVDEIKIKNLGETIILFGSYVNKTYTKSSDIDIAVLGKKSKKLTEFFGKFSQIYGKEINIKYISSFNNKDDFLVKEILKNHLILNETSKFINEVF